MRTKLKVGQVINSTSCGAYIITNITSNKTTVRFIDSGYEVETDNYIVSKGNIKDPLFPQVLGVGFLGIGKYKGKLGPSSGFNSTPEYNAWINMLQRCYYDKYETRVQGCAVYDSVSVCNDWHNFQVFAEWYTEKRKPLDDTGQNRPSLDKDILSASKKANLYSPETCCVIPYEINAMLIGRSKSKENGLPKGVTKAKQGYRVSATGINSETIYSKFETIEECNEWRNSIDQERFKAMAEKYKSVLESLVYTKLCNWDKF